MTTDIEKRLARELPGYARVVLDSLEVAGYEAWVVGGWVRDALLGRPGHDVDVTTSAPWQDTARVLRACGIETEFHHYAGLSHGFGLGTGTTAEGWIDDAAAFWQRQIDKKRAARADGAK